MLKNEIRQFIHKLVKEQGASVNGEIYAEYLLSLAKIAELFDEYSVMGEDGYPKLRAEDYTRLKQAYEAAFQAGKAYTESMQAEAAQNSANASRVQLVEHFADLLAKDYNLFDISLGKEEKTLFDVFSVSRGMKLSVAGNEISSAGANMSSRIPVSFTADNGEKITGFFTETEHVNMAREQKALLAKHGAGHPEYEEAFGMLIKDPNYRKFAANPSAVRENVDDVLSNAMYRQLCAMYLYYLEPSYEGKSAQEANAIRKGHRAWAKTLLDDGEFITRFYEFTREYAALSNKYAVLRLGAEIQGDANIGDRNVAMSEVAAALGTPDLIAHSVKMKLVVDGVEKDGTFMATAEGADLDHLKDDNPLLRVNANSVDNPAAFKSIADLQVLDYICGNVDRHVGNMFYQTEETADGVKLTGVVGIDNDCSMGLLSPESDEERMQLVETSNMLVMSREYADKIASMTPDMLKIRLKGLELSDAEIQAANDRLAHLQEKLVESRTYFEKHKDEKLRQGYIKVVDDDQWADYKITDLAFQPGYVEANKYEMANDNYFFKVATLPEVVANELDEKEKRAATEKKLKAINPRLVPEKQPVRIADAAPIKENNAAGIAHNRVVLDCLKADMTIVHAGWFIGSKKFDKIIKKFDDVRELSNQITTETGSKKMQELANEYKKLQDVIKIYVAAKEKERVDKGGLNERSERRLAYANRLLAFAKEKEATINAEREFDAGVLKEYVQKNGKTWNANVNGKVYSEDMVDDVAKAFVMRNFMKNPKVMDELSVRDFNNAVNLVKNQAAFRDSLQIGQKVNLEQVERNMADQQRPQAKKVDKKAPKQNVVKTV